MTDINFITTTSKLPSQVLGPPELECTWITVQVFCPSTASLTPWLSSTESRPHSLSRSVLDFMFILTLLSSVNSNRQKSFKRQWVKLILSSCLWLIVELSSSVNQTLWVVLWHLGRSFIVFLYVAEIQTKWLCGWSEITEQTLLMGRVNKLKLYIMNKPTWTKSFLVVFIPGSHTELMENMWH